MSRIASSCLLLACLATACGGDDGASTDPDAAAGIDGATTDGAIAPDAAPAPDAMPAPVTVRAFTNVGRAAGVLVAFLDASDAVIATAITDANGEASAIVPEGGKVLATESSTSRTGFLWIGAEPGEVLELRAGTITTTDVSATIVVPTVAGATQYTVFSECSNTSSATTTLTLTYPDRPDCAVQDLVVTSAAPGGQLSFYAPDQVVTGGGTVDLQAQTFVASPIRTLNVINMPATHAGGSFAGRLVDHGHQLGSDLGGTLDPGDTNENDTNTLAYAPGALMLTSAEYSDGNYIGVYQLGPQDDGTLDAAATATRQLDTLEYSQTTETMTWVEAATGLAPQGVFAQLIYGAPAFVGGGGNNITWFVLAPDAGSLAMPAIPASFPLLDIGARSATRVELRLSVHSDGFGAVRTRAFHIEEPEELLTGAGSMAMSAKVLFP